MPSDPTPTESSEPGRTAVARDDSRGEAEPSGGGPAAGDGSGGRPRSEHDTTDPDPDPDPDADRVAALERRVADLEAELDAVRGLLDGVEAVDETVERRASAALAKAEALEARVGGGERGLVRERLPDTDSAGRDSVANEQSAEARRDSAPDAEDDSRRAGSRLRGGKPQDGGGRHGSVGSQYRDERSEAAERGWLHEDGTDGADGRPAGAGAISSVGSDGAATGTDEADRSLAARLRDAFR